MNQRYGAWAHLLVLFRLFHDGAAAGGLRLPQRHGVLFDPDRFPFLEGRGGAGARQLHDRIEPPLVPDGTVYRALDKLLLLDGQRISYRALDVEQIGSVYETMMGFPARDGDRTVSGDQGPEEARRADRGRPRRAGRRAKRAGGRNGCGSGPTARSPTKYASRWPRLRPSPTCTQRYNR